MHYILRSPRTRRRSRPSQLRPTSGLNHVSSTPLVPTMQHVIHRALAQYAALLPPTVAAPHGEAQPELHIIQIHIHDMQHVVHRVVAQPAWQLPPVVAAP